MLMLVNTLELYLAPKPKRIDLDAAPRREFKKLAAANALHFERCTRDGYLESNLTSVFPRGVHFAHYGWGESLRRLEYIIANPDVLDESGYYSE
jgi:hypothetical protein